MKTFLKVSLIVLAVFFVAAAILLTGFFIGRGTWNMHNFWPGSMMGNFSWNMPHSNKLSPRGGMMDYWQYNDNIDNLRCDYGFDMMGSGRAYQWNADSCLANPVESASPLTIDTVESILTDYINNTGRDSALHIGEIMIFGNHAYAQLVEEDTGIGAMEVLVDPVTQEVFPEYGPNMMWNQKYGMMEDMWHNDSTDQTNNMTISKDEAVVLAQEYLDDQHKGTLAEDHPDTFYGYYTLHILKDGEVIGMLSVNGYSGAVFYHNWHGNFIEMSSHQ